MTYDNIQIRTEGQTATVTIHRPAQLNALNRQTLKELDAVFAHELLTNDQVRGVILTGAGDKAFVAGADIKEFMNYSPGEGHALAEEGHAVMNRIYHFPMPVVAAIQGFALGGGLELALACHLRVASEQAKLGLPEVSLGLIPGYGGTQRLAALAGRAKALEMILSGEMIDARDAWQWGIVNQVVPAEDLLATAAKWLEKTYTRSSTAIAAAIGAVNAGLDAAQDGFAEEIRAFGGCFGSDDFREGTEAFVSKRKPNF